MCNTDLKIRFINKEIEIHRLEGLILGVEKRIISLNGRICDLAKADNGDPVEMARLKRNLAHAELDVANYELSVAQAKADMNSLMVDIMSGFGPAPPRRTSARCSPDARG